VYVHLKDKTSQKQTDLKLAQNHLLGSVIRKKKRTN